MDDAGSYGPREYMHKGTENAVDCRNHAEQMTF